MTNAYFDVAVIGGGPAGSAAALTLASRSSLSVALIERGDYSGVRVGETIGPGTLPLLDYLGVAHRVEADGHRRALATAAVWGSAEVFTQDFFFSGRGEGWHLDRNRFDAMLADAAGEAGATVHVRATLRETTRNDRIWRLGVDMADTTRLEISTRFLIDASGRSSNVARSRGAAAETVDQLVGIVGYVAFAPGQGNRDGVAFVESIPEGWWYSAWLPGDLLAVALMSDADLIRPIGAGDIEGWTRLLADAPHTRDRVVGGRRPTRLFARDARSWLLSPGGGDGWLAAGDALSTFDPLSSMGIGHALASGAHAAAVAEAWLDGDGDALPSYVARSAAHFREFLALRRHYYGMEQRWSTSPFWARRIDRSLVARSVGVQRSTFADPARVAAKRRHLASPKHVADYYTKEMK